MNILKNVFNWTVGSFFRTIGRIIAFIVIGFLIFSILQKLNIDITNIFMPKLSASTLTPKSTYTNDTNHIIGQDISSFGSNNSYSYSTALPNLYGEFYWNNSSTGTAVSGKAYAFSLGFQYNLTAQKYYDITINFRDRDLRSVVNTSSIELLGGTSISGLSSNNLSLIGVTNSATSSNNTNKLVVRVYSVQALSYFVVQIYNMQNNITSVNNFGISSVSIQEVDITNSQAIINNQTNNTQNIINNSNDNTQQIIDNQNQNAQQQNINDIDNQRNSFDTINNDCGDLYKYNMIKGKRFNNSGALIDAQEYYYTESYIKLNTTDKIVLSGFGSEGTGTLIVYDSDKNFLDYWTVYDRNVNLSTLQNPYYFRISTNMPTGMAFKNKGCKSKIDTLNDNINDDNVDNASNKATSFFNNFTDNDHGLSSIITMPLNSIRLMLSDNCVAPHTIYKGKTISFPCGDILWSREGASALKDFLNIAYGGLICYYLVRSFFMWINRFKDPDNDKIEVIDL